MKKTKKIVIAVIAALIIVLGAAGRSYLFLPAGRYLRSLPRSRRKKRIRWKLRKTIRHFREKR